MRKFKITLIMIVVAFLLFIISMVCFSWWQANTVEGMNYQLSAKGYYVCPHEQYMNNVPVEVFTNRNFTITPMGQVGSWKYNGNPQDGDNYTVTNMPTFYYLVSIIYVDNLTEFLQINRNNSFYSVSFHTWQIQPIIYWEIHCADSNPVADWWFSNGTVIFVWIK
jgi:hypothetical protein